jgi:glutamate--cysteine ligase
MPAIERWFRLEWMEHTPPFYTSVGPAQRRLQARAGGHSSLFPGGFDHLTPEMLPLAVQAAMAAIEKICPRRATCCSCPSSDNRNASTWSACARLVQVVRAGRA